MSSQKQRQKKSAAASKVEPAKVEEARPNEAAPSLFESLTEGKLLFFVVAAAVLVYANSLSGEFLFDDTKQIVGNTTLDSWGNVWRAFVGAVWDFQRDTGTNEIPPPYYRPFFTVYLILGYKLFGLWPAGWHLLSVAAHAGTTALVYFLVKRLAGKRAVAAAAALLFGVHPTHTESVSWISGIPDPLMALFFVPALIWYERFRSGDGRKYFFWSVAAFAVAVFCKETALSLPVFIAFREVFFRDGRFAERVRRTALLLVPYAVVSAVYLGARLAVLGQISWKHPASATIPDQLIWMSVPFSLVSYLWHLVAPYDLSIFYGTSFVKGATDPRFLVPSFVLVALAAALWFFRRRLTRDAWLALGLTVIPLLPVLNLKVFYEEYIVQDRYLYLPSVGFCWLMALVFAALRRRKETTALAFVFAVAALLGASTVMQNRVWRSSVTLWQQAIRHAPDFYEPHYNLGLTYLQRRDYAAARDELKLALDMKRLPSNYNNLALAQAGLGDHKSAEENFKKAIALNPRTSEARNNLGTMHFERGQYEAAREQFQAALDINPMQAATRFNLARAEAALGRHDSAARHYETLLAKTPRDREARYQLGLSLAALGRREEARRQIESAMQGGEDAGRLAEMRDALARLETNN